MTAADVESGGVQAPPAIRTGGCLCGRVRYTVPSQPLATVICHCRNCQKQGGSAFSLIAVYRRDDLHVQGGVSVYVDRGTSGMGVLRHFCGNCGSPIFSDAEQNRERGLLYLKAGTLDDVKDLEPTVHYWTKSAHSWFALPEDLHLLSEQ